MSPTKIIKCTWPISAGWAQNASKPCSGSFLALLCGLAPECCKTVLWELPGSTLRAGSRTPQNCVLGASWPHFAGWAQNAPKPSAGSVLAPLCGLAPECCKTVLWELPASTLRAGSRIPRNCVLGASWEPSGPLGSLGAY